jgi:MtaA/CmuA family methyltransferase
MTPRQLLLDTLDGRPTPRPAVVCPGGMMSMAVAEVMDSSGAAWPEAHTDAAAMSRLALAMQQATGFDAIAMPFCMTVEAEAYGAAIDLGARTSQPRARSTVLAADGSGDLRQPDWQSGRPAVLLEAIGLARAARPDVAVIGNLVGPFSLLGTVADSLQVLRWTRRTPAVVGRHMERLTSDLAAFGRLQVAAGAEVICIADPTATGEILGGALFEASVRPHLARLVADLAAAGARVIVHICGRVEAIDGQLRRIAAHAVSYDSDCDIVAVAASRPPWLVMGNLSPIALERGPAESILRRTRRLAEGGVRLLAPACGVVPTTPVANLRAMRSAVDV